MNIKLRLSTLLRQIGELSSEPDTLEMEMAGDTTPLDCIQSVAVRYPTLNRWLYDETGKLRPVIFVFVNGEKLLADEMTRPLKEGDEVFVVLSFAGG